MILVLRSILIWLRDLRQYSLMPLRASSKSVSWKGGMVAKFSSNSSMMSPMTSAHITFIFLFSFLRVSFSAISYCNSRRQFSSSICSEYPQSISSLLQIISMLSKYPPIFLLFCLVAVRATYLPELMAATTSDFLNWELAQNGDAIEKFIENATIPAITFDDKFQGVHVQFNLTNITKKVNVHWQGNVFNVDGPHNFTIMSKNINVTLDGHVEFKIGLALKQKGTLVIQMEKLETDTSFKFTQPPCEYAGIGFDLQITGLFVRTDNLVIKIEGKGVDNIIIRALMSVLKSRLPGIIEGVALNSINPMITAFTCSDVKEQVVAGEGVYIAQVNTTEVPYFEGKNIYFPVDITLKNEITNATNNEVEDDNLPLDNDFIGVANVTAVASSNMLNTIMWLVDDSKILKLNVTQKDLGPSPPIDLDTRSLSILLPGLSKWGKRSVILLVEPSSKFSHLYIRNGRIVAALSLSVKFVVNVTASVNQTAVECLETGDCVIATDLNITLPLAIAAHIDSGSIMHGLVHSISIEKIQVLSSEISVNTESLSHILNTMVGSFRPQINKMLHDGVLLDISQLEKFLVKDVVMNVKKDHTSLGLLFST